MPRKFELTYFKAKQQWKKKKYGKVHYLGHGESRWDAASYELALARWRELEPELEVAHQKAVDPRTPEQKEIDRWWTERPLRGISEAGRWIAADRAARQKPADQAIPTIDKMLQRFIERKRRQAESEQRSAGRYINLKMYAEQFADFLGREKLVTAIDAAALLDYHSKALADMASGSVTSWCGRDRMQAARQFITFVWEMGLIELPRNIRSRDLFITCSAAQIDVFDPKRLREIIDAVPERLRLWLLLMANCGMTQKDVADLRADQLDWERGVIKRKRSKTKQHESVPVVTYTLWPVTLDLLRRHGRRTGRLFLNGGGGALAGTTLTAKGGKFDAIGKAYNAFLVAKKIDDGKTLKAIRKTSATLMASHAEFGKFAQYFLGQASRTVADKHYVRPTEEQFARALVWLGESYGY